MEVGSASIDEYHGVTFAEEIEWPCSVSDCYFLEIRGRAIRISTPDSVDCIFHGCLFFDVGITNSSSDGGVILFESKGSRLSISETVFDGSPTVKYGIFARIISASLDISFIDMAMHKNVGTGHMSLSCISKKGSLKYTNFSNIKCLGNTGLQPFDGTYKAKYIQTVHSDGFVLFRAAIDKKSVLSKFIFANCNPSRGIFSLYYGEYSMADAVFSNISAPIIYTGHLLEGYDCYLITLTNPVFHGFDSFQSHPSLIIQCLSSVAREPTIITRFVMMRRNLEIEGRSFGVYMKLKEIKNILMTFFALIDINCKTDD